MSPCLYGDVQPSSEEQLGMGTGTETHGGLSRAGSQRKQDMLLKVLGSFSRPRRKEAVTGKSELLFWLDLKVQSIQQPCFWC